MIFCGLSFKIISLVGSTHGIVISRSTVVMLTHDVVRVQLFAVCTEYCFLSLRSMSSINFLILTIYMLIGRFLSSLLSDLYHSISTRVTLSHQAGFHGIVYAYIRYMSAFGYIQYNHRLSLDIWVEMSRPMTLLSQGSFFGIQWLYRPNIIS